jgi:hypothetical protein
MKILVCGDSWSYGCGVLRDWSRYLPHTIENYASNGAGSDDIVQQFDQFYDQTFDLIIIGWSGASRHHDNEFCITTDKSIEYFKDKSLDYLLDYWCERIDYIEKKSQQPVLHFSVFGDMPNKKYDNFIDMSFFKYIANCSGFHFKYDTPIFEFDLLTESNLQVTEPFGKKYFPKHWKRACVEREEVRGKGHFLECGHPDQQGQKLWGAFMEKLINDTIK